MDKEKIYGALGEVLRDAKNKKEWHVKQLNEKPLYGWSEEKHDTYHRKYIAQCEQVINYCFWRQMQINPD